MVFVEVLGDMGEYPEDRKIADSVFPYREGKDCNGELKSSE